MTITMLDSVTASAIPTDAQAAAGYVNGIFANYEEIVARTPHAHHLSISITADQDADCLDIENGDATISQAPGWVRRQHARGVKLPVVYTSISNVGALVQTLTDAGIHRNEYKVWSAHYTGTPHIEGGSDATQYEENAGQDLDYSLCYDEFFAVPPNPPHPKPPAPPYVPSDEHNWETEWDKIVSRKTLAAHLRRVFLKEQMLHREREIVVLATKQKNGWEQLNRKDRYEKLFARTKER